MKFTTAEYFDLEETAHATLFEGDGPVWEVLTKISTYLKFRLKPANHGTLIGRPFISNQVFIGEGTVVEHGAMVKGPAWIGSGCHIRNGAYIRENVILGDGVVAGNSCEFKNCVLFNGAEVPHFNYVGDSILGYRAHLGAGVILSNVRLNRKEIEVRSADSAVGTGLRKFGAMVGDRVEIGCNSVVNPGALIGPRCVLYPGSVFTGVLAADRIVRTVQTQQVVERVG